MTCINLDELKKVVQENTTLILNAGYSKNLAAIMLDDVQQVVRAVFLHSTIFRSMAELEQLKGGLNVLGVCNDMEKNPDHFVQFFTGRMDDTKLSAGL